MGSLQSDALAAACCEQALLHSRVLIGWIGSERRHGPLSKTPLPGRPPLISHSDSFPLIYSVSSFLKFSLFFFLLLLDGLMNYMFAE